LAKAREARAAEASWKRKFMQSPLRVGNDCHGL
jgi:hypothetical protein